MVDQVRFRLLGVLINIEVRKSSENESNRLSPFRTSLPVVQIAIPLYRRQRCPIWSPFLVEPGFGNALLHMSRQIAGFDVREYDPWRWWGRGEVGWHRDDPRSGPCFKLPLALGLIGKPVGTGKRVVPFVAFVKQVDRIAS